MNKTFYVTVEEDEWIKKQGRGYLRRLVQEDRREKIRYRELRRIESLLNKPNIAKTLTDRSND
jgi:hypothetical protein